jgi:hypothetical protein
MSVNCLCICYTKVTRQTQNRNLVYRVFIRERSLSWACLVLQFYYLVSLCILSAHVLVCSLLSVLQFCNVHWAKFVEFVLKVDSSHWCSYTFWFCQQICSRSSSRATKLQVQSWMTCHCFSLQSKTGLFVMKLNRVALMQYIHIARPSRNFMNI